ncbi:MAG: amidase [Pseudomonadota bacterium]
MGDDGRLTLAGAARDVADGLRSSSSLVEACLARIAEREGEVKAWAFIDPEAARTAAAEADAAKAAGVLRGPLHGVPIGVKDIIDVAGMPCGYGSPAFDGRRPRDDAACIRPLTAAGAVILGKTATTEMAAMHPAATRNPLALDRTPGGSSAGSAAAVADGMAFGALGTQTNGSVIRPASFCGVVGYKPSYGLIPRGGVLACAPSLDTIGVFAGTVEDAALLAETMMRFEETDGASVSGARRDIRATTMTDPPVTPKLACVEGPVWGRAEDTTRAALGQLADALGDKAVATKHAGPLDRTIDLHRTVMLAELAANYGAHLDRAPETYSRTLRDMRDAGAAVLATDYIVARAAQAALPAMLDEVFEDADAILAPAAPGEAPMGVEATGDPIFSTMWQFLGLPSVTVPLLVGPNDLPLGAQLIGAWGDDARLLRTARWLMNQFIEAGDSDA